LSMGCKCHHFQLPNQLIDLEYIVRYVLWLASGPWKLDPSRSRQSSQRLELDN